MDEDILRDEIEEALSQEEYFLGDYTYVGKDGVKKLVDKCVNYALKNPTADIIAYAHTLVSETRYKIIWSCPDPITPIDNWFSEWLPDNCVSAYFYAGDEEGYSLIDMDYPKWSELPYAPYFTYSVPSDIQNQIKEQAMKDLADVDGAEDYEDGDLCARCLVMEYQILR